MPTFAWDTIYYPTLQSYKAALLPFAVPAWIKGVTIHHTLKPTADQWRGRRSMDALERYYRATLKWPAGPHLFLAPDGLWAGTPLASTGVHAGACNTSHIGLEVVGNFDAAPWGVGLRERIYQLVITLLQWTGLTETAVQGHRECLNNKSCPGGMINMHQVRADLSQRLFDQRFIVQVDAANVRAAARTNSTVLQKLERGAVVPGHPVRGSAYQGDPRWARVKLPSGRLGFVWAQLGRWEPI